MKTFEITYRVVLTCKGTLEAQDLEDAKKKWDANYALHEEENPIESPEELISIKEKG